MHVMYMYICMFSVHRKMVVIMKYITLYMYLVTHTVKPLLLLDMI